MDTCGICQKPAVQLFETGKDGVYACFKCQPLVPEITLEDNSSDNSQAQTAPEQTFQKNMQLQNHLRNHRAERRFVCTYCNKAFSQSNNLRAHLRIHTNERPFKCNECGKAFTQVTNLNNHVRLHTGERPFVCPEPGCDKAYAQVTNLNQHRKRHLSGRPIELSYECNVCGEQFAQRNHMTNHRRVAHGDVTKSPGRPVRRSCSICELSFPNDRLLQLHTSHAHSNEQSETEKSEFACVFSTCGMRFATPKEHTEHLLRAHQLRVLATSANEPAKRGRPPKTQDKHDEAYVEHLKRVLGASYSAVETRPPKSQHKQVNGSRRRSKPVEVSSDEDMTEEYLEEEPDARELQEDVQEEIHEEIQEEYLETVMKDPLEIKETDYPEVKILKQPQYMPKLKVQSLFQ